MLISIYEMRIYQSLLLITLDSYNVMLEPPILTLTMFIHLHVYCIVLQDSAKVKQFAIMSQL